MNAILNHMYFPLAVFMTAAAIALYMFVSAANTMHTGGRIVVGILLVGVAIYFAPEAFRVMR